MNMEKNILELSSTLNLINSNLTELINSDEYLFVKNARYTDETKKEIDKAIITVDNLWKKYLSLSGLFEKISTVSRHSFISFDRDEKIKHLIKETKFEIEKKSIPLEDRNLLSSSVSVKEVYLEDLIKVMVSDFDNVKQTVFTVLTVNKKNQIKINTIDSKINQYSQYLSADEMLDFEKIKDSIINNPLMANKIFDSFLKMIKSLDEKIEEEKKLLVSLQKEISIREQKIVNFENYLHKKMGEITVGSKFKSVDVLDATEIKDLKNRLNIPIDKKNLYSEQNKIKEWDIDFARLSHVGNENLRKIYDINTCFNDLVGLYTALNVKFKLCDSKGLVSESLLLLKQDIKKILEQEKIDIQNLEKKVNQYQKELFLIKNG